MKHVFTCGVLLALICFGIQSLSPFSKADDAKEKKDAQKKDDDKSKDKKSDGVKRSQTTFVSNAAGRITKVDDTTLTLEITQGGKRVPLEDIIIAEDVKVRLPAEPEFDSKGKPKPPKVDPADTDRKLGGVKGSKEDLREMQMVTIKLGKYKKKLVATVILVQPEKK